MPHDDQQKHWHEVSGDSQKAGLGTFVRPPMPYDKWMMEQEIPIFRDIGISKVQNLPLKPWKRMGGRGSFIQLYGTESMWGMYLVEVPAAGALNAEKHTYEEMFLVIEGRGTTEVWVDGQEGRLALFVLVQRYQFKGVRRAGLGQRGLGAEGARAIIAIQRVHAAPFG